MDIDWGLAKKDFLYVWRKYGVPWEFFDDHQSEFYENILRWQAAGGRMAYDPRRGSQSTWLQQCARATMSHVVRASQAKCRSNQVLGYGECVSTSLARIPGGEIDDGVESALIELIDLRRAVCLI